MKKIAYFAIAVTFVTAFGVAYADVPNGITAFNGKSIDTLTDLYPAASDTMPNAVEGSNAGGLRPTDLGIEEMSNGITDFTDRSYDAVPDFDTAVPAGKLHSIVKSAPRLPEAVSEPGKPLTN